MEEKLKEIEETEKKFKELMNKKIEILKRIDEKLKKKIEYEQKILKLKLKLFTLIKRYIKYKKSGDLLRANEVKKEIKIVKEMIDHTPKVIIRFGEEVI